MKRWAGRLLQAVPSVAQQSADIARLREEADRRREEIERLRAEAADLKRALEAERSLARRQTELAHQLGLQAEAARTLLATARARVEGLEIDLYLCRSDHQRSVVLADALRAQLHAVDGAPAPRAVRKARAR
jgi:chromosome segregation ATPase